jgi:hypothetical protein
MADKVKILIVDDCKLGGKHIDQGTVIAIDPDNAQDKTNYALLVHAGRIAEATPENIAKVKAIKDAKEESKAAARAQSSGQTQAEQIAGAVVKVLAEMGVIKAPKAA